MECNHLLGIDLNSYIFCTDDNKDIIDIEEWIALNGLDEYLLKKIIDVLWKTIV